MAVTATQAIKKFFEADGGRRLSMEELKALTHEERQELGELSAKALGEEFTLTPKK